MEVFDFGDKTPDFDKSQIVLFTMNARHPFFVQHLIPFTSRGCIDKPIIFLNAHGEIEEMCIISAISDISGRNYGVLFSLYNGKKGVRFQNNDNHARVFEDFVVVTPDEKYHFFTDVVVEDEDACICNDNVSKIMDMLHSLFNEEMRFNDIKFKYTWDSNDELSIMIGSASYE